MFIRRLKKRIRGITRSCVLDFGDYRRTVFVAGTGRSGTTWVEEIVNHANDYRVMFEPFHSLEIDRLKHWNYKQYLRVDNDSDRFLKPAAAILGGKIRHPWIDKFNNKLIARKRLIKDIRANLFLKWIKHHFPEIPIILLLRHPCVVANSRRKLKWNCHLDDLLSQPDLLTDYLQPFQHRLETAADPFDKHVFMWCVENFIPLTQFSPGEILVVFYEHLCGNPREEIERIMAFLGEPLPGPLRDVAANPSALSRDESAVRTGADPIESWRKHVDGKQVARAMEICGDFGMNAIYGEGSLPLLNGDAALNAFSP